MSDSKSKLVAVTETVYSEVDQQAALDAAARRSSKKPTPLATKAVMVHESIGQAIHDVISGETTTEDSARETIPVPINEVPAGIHEAIARDVILSELSIGAEVGPSATPVPGKPAIIPPPLSSTTDIDGLGHDRTGPQASGDSPDEAPDLIVGEVALDAEEEFEVSFDDLLAGSTIPDEILDAEQSDLENDRPTVAPPEGVDFEEVSSRKTGDYTEIAGFLFKFMEKNVLTGAYSPEYEDYLTAQRAYEDSRPGGTPIAEPDIIEYAKKYAKRVQGTKNS